MTSLRVVVVGAGIGGLAAALTLRAANHEVVVLEQARRLGEVGAGLALTPNAVLVTRLLGISEQLAGFAVRPTHMIRRRWADGTVLGSLPLARPDEDGPPYWHVHRADLHRVLWQAADQHDPAGPPVRLHLGARIDHLETGPDGVAAVTTDGARFEADLLVGADGIHSVVRDHLGESGDPVHSGDMAYRALVPRRDIEGSPDLVALFGDLVMNNWLGPERHIVHYWVRGGALLNVVAIVPGDHDRTESWTTPGDPRDLVQAFTGWDDRLVRLLGCVRETARWALYDRSPLARWTDGRVGLLGDACHAMLPYQAQGGAQTLEDAVAIGRAMTGVDRDGVAEALRTYEARRRPRASELQTGARANRELYHLPDGPAQRRRDEDLRSGGGEFGSLPRVWAPAF